MNIPILNRDFTHPADGWYNIEAKGLHPNRNAKLVQVIDDEACASIVNRFNQEAAQPGWWRRLPTKAKAGVVLFGLFVLTAIIGPLVTPYDPSYQNPNPAASMNAA